MITQMASAQKSFEIISLRIDIVSCKNLLVGDITSSDPYVKVKLGEKVIHRTKYIFKTLNPVFSEKTDFSFILNCTKKELNDGLEFCVKDYDLLSNNEALGSVTISAQVLIESSLQDVVEELKLEAPKKKKKKRCRIDYNSYASC